MNTKGSKENPELEDHKSLFDKFGRRIPKNLQAIVCHADQSFRLDQPKLNWEEDFASRILWLHRCLGIDTGVTAEQFKAETERLLTMIWDNPQIANSTNGVCLPVILPQCVTDDLGTEMERYLDGVVNSYTETFGYSFDNCHEGELKGNVSIIDGSRHDQLVSRMKHGPVIGIYFPNPLQGFSSDASREQMSTLPEEFILSGMDALIAIIMYPDVLFVQRDELKPVLSLSALACWSDFHLLDSEKTDDNKLGFANTEDASALAHGNCSSSLLFIG